MISNRRETIMDVVDSTLPNAAITNAVVGSFLAGYNRGRGNEGFFTERKIASINTALMLARSAAGTLDSLLAPRGEQSRLDGHYYTSEPKSRDRFHEAIGENVEAYEGSIQVVNKISTIYYGVGIGAGLVKRMIS